MADFSPVRIEGISSLDDGHRDRNKPGRRRKVSQTQKPAVPEPSAPAVEQDEEEKHQLDATA